MAYNVMTDKQKCVGCGECVDVCPVSVYQLQNHKAEPLDAKACIGCEACVEVCPADAITIEEA